MNNGCSVVYSRKYTVDHDAVCPHKIVQCSRECGDTFPRRQMEVHMNESCPLRPVKCPLADIGCPMSLRFVDLPEHMDSAGTSHLLLAIGAELHCLVLQAFFCLLSSVFCLLPSVFCLSYLTVAHFFHTSIFVHVCREGSRTDTGYSRSAKSDCRHGKSASHK